MTTSRRARISEAELDYFRRMIRARSGIELPTSRDSFLEMRIHARLKRLRMNHPGEYRSLLAVAVRGR